MWCFFHFLIFRDLLIWKTELKGPRERDRKRFSICWVTTTMARAGPSQSWELELYLGHSHRCRCANTWATTASSRALSERCIGSGVAGTWASALWDAMWMGRGLTFYARPGGPSFKAWWSYNGGSSWPWDHLPVMTEQTWYWMGAGSSRTGSWREGSSNEAWTVPSQICGKSLPRSMSFPSPLSLGKQRQGATARQTAQQLPNACNTWATFIF